MNVFATKPVRVLVIDDSVAFREAAHELINTAAGFEWVGDACCGEEGIDETLRLRPDLVLVDVRMPGIGGIEAASRIAAHASPPVVLLITGEEPPEPPCGKAIAVLAKDRLTHASLRQVWDGHSGE